MSSASGVAEDALGVPADAGLRIWRRMATIRAADERLGRGLGAGEFTFAYYGIRGQEAIPSVLCERLAPDDRLVTTYRNLHDAVAKGVALEELFGEYLGRATGTSAGKGGPMHLADPAHGLMATSGVVGGGVPIAVGLGLAASLTASGRVAVASFGDGAMNIGSVHEALNLAAVWDLPVVFLCQRNNWGEHTRYEHTTRTALLADRVATYGIASVTVDGLSVPALWEAFGAAVDRARSGGGPSFVEAIAPRLDGHAFGTGTDEMDPEELALLRSREPVAAFRLALDAAGLSAAADEIEASVRALVEAALAAAVAAPAPDPSTLLTDVTHG
jgi:TPP-dependent pyruvate/acetoin dehydrogenase alpha subunit